LVPAVPAVLTHLQRAALALLLYFLLLQVRAAAIKQLTLGGFLVGLVVEVMGAEHQ
jgi:hypothetical protein